MSQWIDRQLFFGMRMMRVRPKAKGSLSSNASMTVPRNSGLITVKPRSRTPSGSQPMWA